MIKIDEDSKILYLKTEPESYDDIKKRSEEEFHEFPLISGYVCPECNRVIIAYYIGSHPHIHNDSNPFQEKTKHYDNRFHHGDLSCKEGTCHGGSYYKLKNHEHQCEYKIYSTRGIFNALNEIYVNGCSKEDSITLTKERLLLLIERISNGEVPGMTIIKDVCGVDEPILAINQKEIGTYKGSGWVENKAIEYMIKYSAAELPVDEPEEETESEEKTKKPEAPEETEIETELSTNTAEETTKFTEHLGKDVIACQTKIFGGGTTLMFTDGSEALVYPGKDFDIAGKIQTIFGKMDPVPFNTVNLTALNNILADA